MGIANINTVTYETLAKVNSITKANISKIGTVAGAVAAATGPSPYTQSMYLDSSSDYFKVYGNNVAGSGGYQNTRAETAFWRDPILDNTTAFSIDAEFRPQASTTGAPLVFDWGNYNMQVNGGININVYAWGATGMYVLIRWYRRSTGGDGYGGYLARYHWFNNAATGMGAGHFTDALTRGFWHKLTITKNTGTSFKDDVKVYINGREPNSLSTAHSNGTGTWDADETIPNDATWVDADNNQGFSWINWPTGSSYSNLGSLSCYNKELSIAEINDLYDGGARLGGSADQTKILNINPTTASTAGNLVHYFYYNSAVDSSSGALLIDKIAGGVDPEMKLNTGTLGALAENTIPQINRFDVSIPPIANYAGTSITLSQATGSGGPVTWYSDSGRTSLVNTGETYTFTAPAAGSQTLYTRDTHSSGVTQDGTFPYTTYPTAGYLDYSYNFGHNGGETGYIQQSSTSGGYFDSADFAADGSFALTQWYTTGAAIPYNGHIFWLIGDSSWHGYVYIHLSATYPWFYVKINNVQYSLQFNTHATYGGTVPGWAHDSWRCVVLSHDVTAGSFTCFSNGVKIGTLTDANYENPVIKPSVTNQAYLYSPYAFGKVANLAIYDDHLTDAEGIAICGSSNTPGASVDLASLSGSSSKLVEYWKFEEVHDNDGLDRLTGEIDAGHYFSLNSSSWYANNSARRTADRP